MSSLESTEQHAISDLQQQPFDTCIAFALLWMVQDRGMEELEAINKLTSFLDSLPFGKNTLQDLNNLVTNSDRANFIYVFSTLRSELNEEEREFFLNMAIEIIAESKKITTTANHILRFYADLLEFDEEQLAVNFERIYGKALPPPEDLSSSAWWAASDYRTQSDDIDEIVISQAQALALLGINSEASPEQIKQAYRRQMQALHPDRFVGGSEAAKRSAESKFILVRKAYEVLKS